jgi:hypothetical protein
MSEKSRTLTLIRDAARKIKRSECPMIDPMVNEHDDHEIQFMRQHMMPAYADDFESAQYAAAVRYGR